MRALFILLVALLPFKWDGWTSKSKTYNPVQTSTVAYWDGKTNVTTGTADSLTQWADKKSGLTLTTALGTRPVLKHPYLEFTGSEYTTGSDWSDLDFGTNDFSVSIRMYVSTYPAVLAIPAAKMNSSVTTGWRFYINSSGQIYLQLIANGNQLNYRLNAGDIDGLHNFTFVVDRANNKIYCYRDGVQITTVAVTTTLLTTDDISNAAGFHVGRYDYTGGYFFIGRIYALRLDKGKMTLQDAQKLHEYWDERL